jgi:hypothetical protein
MKEILRPHGFERNERSEASLRDAVGAFVRAQVAAATETRLTAPGLGGAFTRAQLECGAWVPLPAEQSLAQLIGLTEVIREQLRVLVPEHPKPGGEPDTVRLNWRNAADP